MQHSSKVLLQKSHLKTFVFFHCEVCDLIFKDPSKRLSPEQEKARYQTHQNSPSDQGYRDFLTRLLKPLSKTLTANASGLDYGCGPGPTTSVILEEQGFSVQNYDPLFAPKEELLNKQYDFITCSETAEHFYNPKKEFEKLNTLLKPEGWLGVMTSHWSSLEEFPSWYYHRDETHVVFYHPQTMNFVAKEHNWKAQHPAPNVTLFQKTNTLKKNGNGAHVE